MKTRPISLRLILSVLVIAALACNVPLVSRATPTPTATPLPRSAAVSAIENEVEARADAAGDPLARDRERAGDGQRRVHRADDAVVEDHAATLRGGRRPRSARIAPLAAD